MEKNKKYILHIMGMESSKYGGIEKFNVELSSQLEKRGYTSIFIYEKYPAVQQFYTDIVANKALFFCYNSKKTLSFIFKLIYILIKYKPHVVHAHFTKARFYAVPIAHLLGFKNIIYTVHSTMPLLNDIKLWTNLWYTKVNRYSRIVAVSKQIEETIKKNWPFSSVSCIYMGIESRTKSDKIKTREELDIDTEKLVFLTVANYNHVKGLDTLCYSIKELANKGFLEDKLFYIVGQEQQDIKELSNLIKQLGIEEYVKMQGIRNDVYKFMNAADIYIQPSRNEGLPLALMEACSMELPIIASNVGGIPEIAIDNVNALLFNKEDYIKLADNILTLSDDKSLRNKFSIQSKEIYNKNFTRDCNVMNLIDYYSI